MATTCRVSSFGFKRHDLFLFNVPRREWAAHTRKNTWRHGHGAAEFRRNSDQTTQPRPRNDDATNDASTTLLSRDVDVRMRHFCASSLMIARKCSFAVLEYLWAQCVFRAIRVGEKVTQNLLGTTLIREFVHVCAFAVLSTTCRR